jgi:hypothetical protein
MKGLFRTLVEVGFIIFLFYSNLLMAEFERSGVGRDRGLMWAIGNIFTASNLAVALAAALVGCVLIEFLRNRL